MESFPLPHVMNNYDVALMQNSRDNNSQVNREIELL